MLVGLEGAGLLLRAYACSCFTITYYYLLMLVGSEGAGLLLRAYACACACGCYTMTRWGAELMP